jgi:imidazole glycerol-phosphate synthase subunit HisH
VGALCMIRVGIIDYGMGNLTSVRNACAAIGADAEILARPQALSEVSHIVLPGVGAFGDGMRNIRDQGWREALEREVRGGGKPFLGICLGMQLLAAQGTEHGDHQGLGWIPGVVLRLPDDGGTVRVPHIGWNDVVPVRHDANYADGFVAPGVFYFVHSYHLVPADASVVDGWCDYGTRFAASIACGNIRAVQFHPEKSQQAGLKVLRNFLGA